MKRHQYSSPTFAKASPKPKNPRSERPQYYLKRSSDAARVAVSAIQQVVNRPFVFDSGRSLRGMAGILLKQEPDQ
jgi:hypothetical protein